MENELFILWTNDSELTAEKMVFMYAKNSLLHGWWDKVTLIIWGATAKLVGENKAIQDSVKELMEHGVFVSACKACADQLDVASAIKELGVELKYWGEPLTELIKSNKKLITV